MSGPMSYAASDRDDPARQQLPRHAVSAAPPRESLARDTAISGTPTARQTWLRAMERAQVAGWFKPFEAPTAAPPASTMNAAARTRALSNGTTQAPSVSRPRDRPMSPVHWPPRGPYLGPGTLATDHSARATGGIDATPSVHGGSSLRGTGESDHPDDAADAGIAQADGPSTREALDAQHANEKAPDRIDAGAQAEHAAATRRLGSRTRAPDRIDQAASRRGGTQAERAVEVATERTPGMAQIGPTEPIAAMRPGPGLWPIQVDARFAVANCAAPLVLPAPVPTATATESAWHAIDETLTEDPLQPRALWSERATPLARQRGPGRVLSAPSTPDPQPQATRLHAQWRTEGLQLWLGVDGTAAQVAMRSAAIVQGLRRALQTPSQRLSRVVCNGSVVFDASLPTAALPGDFSSLLGWPSTARRPAHPLSFPTPKEAP